MTPSPHVLVNNGVVGNKQYEKKKLEADLAAVESLIARITQLEDRAAAHQSSQALGEQDEEMDGEGEEDAAMMIQMQPQQQHSHSQSHGGWDEGSGERQSSSHGAEDTGGKGMPPLSDAFTKERSAVGARMTVASSSSDIRAAGHKRDPDVVPALSKKPKIYEGNTIEDEYEDKDEQLSEGSLSRRHGEAENGSNHTMSTHTLHSSEEASSQRRDEYDEVWQRCLRVLSDLNAVNKEAWVFNQPVQVLWPNLANYDQVIQHPMDLGTVRSRVENKYYSSPREFARDVRLTFDNAIKYNMKGSTYYKLAKRMLQKFDSSFKAVERFLENRHRAKLSSSKSKLAAEAVSKLPVAPVAVPPPPIDVVEVQAQIPAQEQDNSSHARELAVVTPTQPDREVDYFPKSRTKVKGLNPRLGRQTNSQAYGGCRALSVKEKAKLSELVDSFPADRMNKVIEILKQQNPDLLADKREVELDLDKLDTRTQFDLYRLAMNWQKSKNKVLLRSKLSMSAEEQDGFHKHGGGGGNQVENSDNNNIDIVGLDSPLHEQQQQQQQQSKEDKKKKDGDGGGANGEGEGDGDSTSDTGSSSDSSTSGSDSSGSSSDSESEAEAESEKG